MVGSILCMTIRERAIHSKLVGGFHISFCWQEVVGIAEHNQPKYTCHTAIRCVPCRTRAMHASSLEFKR